MKLRSSASSAPLPHANSPEQGSDSFYETSISANGTLITTLTGPFDGASVDKLSRHLLGKLKKNRAIRRAEFDASHIPTLFVAAGRLLDLAVLCHDEKHIPVLLRIPAPIYKKLQESTPREMKAPPITKTKVRGIEVEAIPFKEEPGPTSATQQKHSLAEQATGVAAKEPKTLLRCTGKIRSVMAHTVTVSLFIGDDEIIGELDPAQFPSKHLVPGLNFDYCARATTPGDTSINIKLRTPQRPTDEDLLDMAKELRELIPE